MLKPGDRIQVTDANGRKAKGTLRALTTSSLELLVRPSDDNREPARERRLSEGEVRKIVLERHDSPLQGALIGLAVGAGPGVVLIIGRERGSDPVQDVGTAMQVTLIPGAIGAAIGLMVDSARYERRSV